MVQHQVRTVEVFDDAVLDVLSSVPREQFVPRPLRDVAYAESEIALGGGRSMLSPRVFAKMLEAAQIGADDLVLDLAPGLGYSTAVLAQLAAAVVAVEPDEAMAKQASETLQRLEYDNVVVSAGDPAVGDADHAPFDVIFVGCGVEIVDADLVNQLKVGGRMVAIHMNGAVGQCRVTVKSASTATARPIFDAAAPVLDGFEKKATFTF